MESENHRDVQIQTDLTSVEVAERVHNLQCNVNALKNQVERQQKTIIRLREEVKSLDEKVKQSQNFSNYFEGEFCISILIESSGICLPNSAPAANTSLSTCDCELLIPYKMYSCDVLFNAGDFLEIVKNEVNNRNKEDTRGRRYAERMKQLALTFHYASNTAYNILRFS